MYIACRSQFFEFFFYTEKDFLIFFAQNNLNNLNRSYTYIWQILSIDALSASK